MRKLDEWCRSLAPADEAGVPLAGDPPTVSCIYMVYDAWSRELTFANAGHDAPIMMRTGCEPAVLALAGGPPLGTVDDFQYSIEQRQLAPGEVLLAYTDGVTEAQDKNHALYSGTRLDQLLASAPMSSAKAVVDFVRDDVRRFAAGAEQADDITLMAVRWLGPKTPA